MGFFSFLLALRSPQVAALFPVQVLFANHRRRVSPIFRSSSHRGLFFLDKSGLKSNGVVLTKVDVLQKNELGCNKTYKKESKLEQDATLQFSFRFWRGSGTTVVTPYDQNISGCACPSSVRYAFFSTTSSSCSFEAFISGCAYPSSVRFDENNLAEAVMRVHCGY